MKKFTVVVQGTVHVTEEDLKPLDFLMFSLKSFHCALFTTCSSAQRQSITETAGEKMGHYSLTMSLSTFIKQFFLFQSDFHSPLHLLFFPFFSHLDSFYHISANTIAYKYKKCVIFFSFPSIILFFTSLWLFHAYFPNVISLLFVLFSPQTNVILTMTL